MAFDRLTAQTYTDTELEEIRQSLPHHPGDKRIVYAPYNPALASALVQKKYVKAVIIPSERKLAFTRAANNFYKNPDAWLGWEDNFVFENNKLLDFRGPRTKHAYPHLPHLIKENMKRLGKITQERFPGEEIKFELLRSEPGENDGRTPLFHDDGFTTYVSLVGAQFEFVTGNVNKATEKFLDDKREKYSTTKTPPELVTEQSEMMKDKIERLAHGDIIVFAKGFWHRSSPHVKELGQFAISHFSFDPDYYA